MKVALHVKQHHSLSNVIIRLALLGGLVFGCAYLFLELCSSLLKVIK